MKSYTEIQAEVGAWSAQNFGDQETPYLRSCGRGTVRVDTPRSQGLPGNPFPTFAHLVCMGSLAPLMGMVEEIGELADALLAVDNGAAKDTVADIAIYLCDYLCRENIPWPTDARPAALRSQGSLSIQSAIGKLYRAHLKRFQRIRGHHDPHVFHAARSEAICLLVWHLEAFALCYGSIETLNETLNRVWAEIVQKRDWKTDAVNG